MNRIITVVLCLFALSTLAQKNYTIKKVTGIVTDGDISEWSAIPFTDAFVKHDNAGTATQTTKSKLAWDANNLYLCFYAEDTEIKSTNGAQDSKIFNSDDLIEFFIDANGDGVNYIEVGVNAENVYYDYILKCVTATCGGWSDDQVFDLAGFQSAAQFQGALNSNTGVDVSYTVEIKIPFTALNAIPNGGFTTPADGTTWKANMFRVDQKTNTSAEYLSWNPHNSFGFHQPSKFGDFTFSDQLITNVVMVNNEYINVYPNPSTGVFNLSNTVQLLEVYNTVGSLIYSTQNTNVIDLTNVKAGTYFARVFENSVFVTKRIVVVD